MKPRWTALTLGTVGALASGLLGVAGPAQAADGAAVPNAVAATVGVPEGASVPQGASVPEPASWQAVPASASVYPSQIRTPFPAEDNQTYFHPNNPRYAFFVLYSGTPIRAPGLYLYNAATKTWSQRATLDQLPTQWVQVDDLDGNPWPLALIRKSSGTVMAAWL